ncbi:phage baseplate assembly protein V [Dickeya oryzae]|nr:phage baseplate assembly protein V [Dickeya oryzae]
MWDNVEAKIRRAMNGIRQAFRVRLSRVNSSGPVQTFQANGLAGEQIQDAELFQHYGFTSNPPAGTMGIVIPLGGRTSHSVVVATESASYRIKALASGEVAIYTNEGAAITLKKGRIITVDCDEYQVNCKKYIVNANEGADFNTPLVKASGEITDKTSTLSHVREIYDSHNHPGDSGGTTGTPNQSM